MVIEAPIFPSVGAFLGGVKGKNVEMRDKKMRDKEDTK